VVRHRHVVGCEHAPRFVDQIGGGLHVRVRRGALERVLDLLKVCGDLSRRPAPHVGIGKLSWRRDGLSERHGGDAVGEARPGGHLTGISDVSAEVTPKRLEILKQFARRSAPGGRAV
jgi:hypothetical protein